MVVVALRKGHGCRADSYAAKITEARKVRIPKVSSDSYTITILYSTQPTN